MSGEVKLQVPSDSQISVSSVLPVIEFTPFYDTAGNFAQRSPVIIDARRLVEPLPGICSVIVGNEEHVYFPYENYTDQTMSVPLRYNLINRILSPTGEAVPVELYAPGVTGNGFSVPRRHFFNGSGYAGVWQFIGTNNTIPQQLNLCSDRGTGPQCEQFSDLKLEKLFSFPRALVIRLSEASVTLAKSKKWKPSGDARGPFYQRGVASLSKIRSLLNPLKGPNYVCPTKPPQCWSVNVPKAELMKAFRIIYSGSIPKGLLPLKATEKAEMNRYRAILRSIPNRLTKCN